MVTSFEEKPSLQPTGERTIHPRRVCRETTYRLDVVYVACFVFLKPIFWVPHFQP